MGLKLKYNEKANSDPKRKEMIQKIREVIERYNHRDNIENGLKDIGFKKWMSYYDDEFWGLPEDPQELFIYLSWENDELWILFRIEMIDM